MNRLAVIDRQAAQLRKALAPFISKGQSYALVDFPNYANVGDSAIWLGAVALLSGITGRRADYSASIKSYSKEKLNASCREGPIFILGGGNFGDLWDYHQTFRLKLMADFPGRPIIQLPQSIHFESQEWIDDTAKAIGEHGAFTLLVRDHKSEAFAHKHFSCNIELAPDCAFAMGPLSRTKPASEDFIFLKRSDKEIAGFDYSPLDYLNISEADWIEQERLPKSMAFDVVRRSIASLDFKGRNFESNKFNASADVRLRRGLDLLCIGRTVITDRLHGHILSILLGIPVVAFDNLYGKVAGYHKLWMSDIEGAAVVKTGEEALEQIPVVQQGYATVQAVGRA